jgi:long-chain acyl-CoA synthetase
MEVRIDNPDHEGIGEVAVRSKTVMAGYLNEPELTSRAIVDGWLITGDLGHFDGQGHLHLVGRKKNMIVTEEGKNIFPEDIEGNFASVPVKELCVFAADYIWPRRSMVAEQLVLVIHLEPGQVFSEELRRELVTRNNELLNYKRVHGFVIYEQDFPRNASQKVLREALRGHLALLDRATAVQPL